MDKIPETKKTELEKLQELVEEESKEWQKLGMHPNMTVHPPESLWTLKMQVQALLNAVIKKGMVTEDEMNIEFRQLMLDDMRNMRAQATQQRRDALVPEIKLVDPSGKPFKI